MKKLVRILLPGVFCFSLAAFAQPGVPAGPSFGGGMDKLFGDNQSFSATLETQMADGQNGTMTLPGKIAFDAGKSRVEMDMTQAKGTQMPPEATAQMKAMGMDRVVMIGRPDRKIAYVVFPGMQACVEQPLSDAETTTATDYKVQTTELGKETIDTHPCVKNKVIITSTNAAPQEATVWNATDLKNFPVKIQTTQQGRAMTLLFRNISNSKPDASAFETPAGYTKYENVQAMMQATLMKQIGGAFGH